MDREGATPKARDDDSIEAGRVSTVGEGADFGDEASGDLVGEEASAASGFRG